MISAYKDRLEQIRIKLQQAKEKDRELEVFGADSHVYELDAPVSREEVVRFEEQFNITLPEEYVAFITMLGNGGPGAYGGAGPNYGIYPLGDFGYMESAAQHMADECIIDSRLMEKRWKSLTAFDGKLDRDSTEYDYQYNKLFSGLMFIGTLGDSGQMMLILNGKDAGRVVYVNQDLYLPVMKEKFLDWYEKWLDKILAQP